MRLAIVSTLLIAVGLSHSAAAREAGAACDVAGDAVVVETRTHPLSLCSGRRAFAHVRVALGRRGVDKARQGDGRTPLGTYALGEPRTSSRFGTFIPIGYPTPEQRSRGLTGKNVGIHGPDRRAAWLGRLSTWIDWTAGCVATGSDDDVASVAAFVGERRPRIVLR